MSEQEIKPYPLMTEAIRNDKVDEFANLLARFPEFRDLRVPGFGTWLHFACSRGAVSVVRFLVENGHPVDTSDPGSERTALVDACDTGHVRVVEYLLQKGAKLDVSSPGANPLFAAVIGESPEVAQALLEHGIDTHARYTTETMHDMDAIAFAMMRGQRAIARLLALHNANGDEAAAEAAMAEGLRVAEENTVPVPPGQHVRPS